MNNNIVNNIKYNHQTVTIPLPHTGYIDKVMHSNCFEELWELFKLADKPAKEITESYAALSNLKKVCRLQDKTILHIGDGAHARTGILFSYMTKSYNISIDPQINHNLVQFLNKWNTRNFEYQASKFEDFDFIMDEYIISCVHAHVELEEINNKYPNWTYLYSNICCYPEKQTFSRRYMKENNIVEIVDKFDLGIWSDQRNIKIYKNLKMFNTFE